MIKLSQPLLDNKEEKAVLEVLRSGQLAAGKLVEEFETKFVSYIGVKYAAATSSGTSALHLACLSLGLREADEVITTPFSFIASANSILFTGAKPVFVDVGEDFNIDPSKIEEKLTDRTKAILVVHLYGKPVDMDRINAIASKHGIKVIEDACQAHGAAWNEKKVGGLSEVGCFSFYATKNMTTAEGGMVVTNSPEIVEKVKLLRNHGSKVRYHHDILGFNFRMTDINAAIGLVQLRKLDSFNQKRRKNAQTLNTLLRDIPNIVLPKDEKGYHVFHQYTVRILPPLKRDEVKDKLESQGIGCGVFYPIPIHKQKVYSEICLDVSLPLAEKFSNEVLSLPTHPALSKSDLEEIATSVRKATQ